MPEEKSNITADSVLTKMIEEEYGCSLLELTTYLLRGYDSIISNIVVAKPSEIKDLFGHTPMISLCALHLTFLKLSNNLNIATDSEMSKRVAKNIAMKTAEQVQELKSAL